MEEGKEQPALLEHVLVPRHEVAAEKELEELFKRHGITKQNLPLIRSADPAILSLGVKAGDVVKVRRTSPVTGKECFYYRIVVE